MATSRMANQATASFKVTVVDTTPPSITIAGAPNVNAQGWANHGVTVVGLNLGSPLYLDVVAPEKLRSTAQSMLSMVAAGIAAIASNASAGWLLDHGGIDLLYFICGAGAIVLGAASWWILPSAPPSTHKTEEVALSSDALA